MNTTIILKNVALLLLGIIVFSMMSPIVYHFDNGLKDSYPLFDIPTSIKLTDEYYGNEICL